ncbi:MAG: HEAT repeat domain-containing protein [Candidatus Obscuribacterales bacterium]|nr:HEAT repeat domain-containing protein [Candidatus Obscuribacterales bacterium]
MAGRIFDFFQFLQKTKYPGYLLCFSMVLNSPFLQNPASATIVAFPLTIAEMETASDLVVKARVISISPVNLPEKNPLSTKFWKTYKAKLKVISTIKGNSSKEIDFIYRSDHESGQDADQSWINVGPDAYAHFDLALAQSYIIFARKSGFSFIQYSSRPCLRSWEGFIRAADERPVKGKASEIIWTELTNMLRSKNSAAVAYAAGTLLKLSAEKSGSEESNDFDRKKVLEAIFGKSNNLPAALADNSAVLLDFIDSAAYMSPYLSNSSRCRYLWTRASEPVGAWAVWEHKKNTAVLPALDCFFRIADSRNAASAIKVAVISGLGLTQSYPNAARQIQARLPVWLESPDPEIRAAAVYLSSDYAEHLKLKQRLAFLADPSASVRRAAAFSFAFSQSPEALSELGKLLKDPAPEVQAAAALALMTFPVKDKVERILFENLDDKTYGLGFLGRLGVAKPELVKNRLLEYARKTYSPASASPRTAQARIFSNGLSTPQRQLCLKALLNYLEAMSAQKLSGPAFNQYLDTLEKIALCESDYTRDFYALLLTHSFEKRALSFKAKAIKAQPGAYLEQIFGGLEQSLKQGVLKTK